MFGLSLEKRDFHAFLRPRTVSSSAFSLGRLVSLRGGLPISRRASPSAVHAVRGIRSGTRPFRAKARIAFRVRSSLTLKNRSGTFRPEPSPLPGNPPSVRLFSRRGRKNRKTTKMLLRAFFPSNALRTLAVACRQRTLPTTPMSCERHPLEFGKSRPIGRYEISTMRGSCVGSPKTSARASRKARATRLRGSSPNAAGAVRELSNQRTPNATPEVLMPTYAVT